MFHCFLGYNIMVLLLLSKWLPDIFNWKTIWGVIVLIIFSSMKQNNFNRPLILYIKRILCFSSQLRYHNLNLKINRRYNCFALIQFLRNLMYDQHHFETRLTINCNYGQFKHNANIKLCLVSINELLTEKNKLFSKSDYFFIDYVVLGCHSCCCEASYVAQRSRTCCQRRISCLYNRSRKSYLQKSCYTTRSSSTPGVV